MTRFIAVRPDGRFLRTEDGTVIVLEAHTRKAAKHRFRALFPGVDFSVEVER